MSRTFPTLKAVTAAAGVSTALIIGSAGPAQAASTLVAQWNMGDAGSTMADATGRGHTGTLHSVSVHQAGVSGYGFGFSGHPAYVSVPTSADFRPGTSNFTISLSIRTGTRPSASVGDYDLIRDGLSSTAGGSYKMEMLRSGQAFCDVRGGSGEVGVTGGPNLADNRWHKITCTRAGSSVVLTVDGATFRTSGTTGSISNSSTLYLGAKDGGGADQYVGLMDSVSISKG